MKNIKNKKDTRIDAIALFLMLNLTILYFVDKLPILQVISGLALLAISIYYLYLTIKRE